MNDQALQPAATPTPMRLIELAINNNVDPAKLKGLYMLQQRHERSEAKKAFSAAMAAFQRDCPAIHKSRDVKDKNDKRRYGFASFEDVLKVAKPHMIAHGLSYSFGSSVVEGWMSINCHIRVGDHEEIYAFHSQTPDLLKLASALYCNEAQARGAWDSYMKRYCFCNALGIVVTNEDNDLVGQVPEATDKITSAQIKEINELIDKHEIDLAKLLDWRQRESLADFTKQDYDRTIKSINKKYVEKESKK